MNKTTSARYADKYKLKYFVINSELVNKMVYQWTLSKDILHSKGVEAPLRRVRFHLYSPDYGDWELYEWDLNPSIGHLESPALIDDD